MLTIYITDLYNHKVFLFFADNDDDAFKKMSEYLKSKNFKSPYMRIWGEDGGTMIDFGSHSRFFFIER